jgi:hypothetical protein
MSTYHLLGTVISRKQDGSITEVLECYLEALLAGQPLEEHVLVACVCVSMGSILMGLGCIREASYAYDMAKCIYSTIQSSDFDGGLESHISAVGCLGAAAA